MGPVMYGRVVELDEPNPSPALLRIYKRMLVESIKETEKVLNKKATRIRFLFKRNPENSRYAWTAVMVDGK